MCCQRPCLPRELPHDVLCRAGGGTPAKGHWPAANTVRRASGWDLCCRSAPPRLVPTEVLVKRQDSANQRLSVHFYVAFVAQQVPLALESCMDAPSGRSVQVATTPRSNRHLQSAQRRQSRRAAGVSELSRAYCCGWQPSEFCLCVSQHGRDLAQNCDPLRNSQAHSSLM